MINRVILNETSYFGRGSRTKLKDEILKRGYKRVLLVSDETLERIGISTLISHLLEEIRVPFCTFLHIKANPTISNIQEGLQIARMNDIDSIVAVGGGSVLDAAKAISIIMANPEYSNISSLAGVVDTRNKGIPLIALPTTAGTASETTINYVITDEAYRKKMVCIDVHSIPICSIIDPDLMQSMPQQLAASTGMDALTHAMEGYITKAGWLLPDIFHINAMALIYKNIVAASNNKDDIAIEKMAYAQYIAGMGFSNVGLGIVHSMAHSLGAFFDTPHGLANAILLPHVLRFNGKSCPDLFRNMGNAFGLNMEDLNDEEIVEKVVQAVQKLSIELHIPQTLKEIGIPEKALSYLAAQALQDVCTAGNPRYVTSQDIYNIYKEAYE